MEKISRATSPHVVMGLLGNTLADATTRKELRQTWEDYRPAVRGTARGRARKGQLKVPPTATEPSGIAASDLMQALRASQVSFLDSRTTSHQWPVYINVTVTLTDVHLSHQIDAVCAERVSPEQARPGLHGVTIRVHADQLADGPELRAYADVVDTVWLAVPEELAQGAQQVMPHWVGVLASTAPAPRDATGSISSLIGHLLRPLRSPSGSIALKVVRLAGVIPRKADRRGELALELLKRLL